MEVKDNNEKVVSQESQTSQPVQTGSPAPQMDAETIAKMVAAGVTAAISQLGIVNKDVKPQAFTDLKPEDILPEPVPFYAPSVFYIMTEIQHRDGRVSPLPFGQSYIRFEFEASKTSRQGKEQNIQMISKYLCTTKQMLEALRSDVRWNAVFYEASGSKAFDVDTRLTTKLMGHLASLAAKDQGSVFREAMSAGIKTDGGLADIRLKLATHYAKIEMDAEMQDTMARTLNIRKQMALLNNEDGANITVKKV